MKKFFALVLIACMMMTAMATAETVQDQQPPKVVTSVNAAGETVVANIRDAQGAVVAEIKDDGSLILTDVRFRAEGATAAIADRLTGAYESVMADVHFSDVACANHEHAIKVDIDEALAGIEGELDAHDLVMTELYDVALSEEAAAQLAEGCYLEVAFEAAPLVAITTADGEKWSIADATVAGGVFTVKLPQPGTLALLSSGREIVKLGEANEEKVETSVPGTEVGPVDIHFEHFTPSVSGKEAPEVITFSGTDGEKYSAYIRNSAGAVITMVPDKNYIVTTAISESLYTADIQTYEHLESNFGDILTAENVGVLKSDKAEGTIAADLDATLAAMNLDITHEQLVIKDLFEVTAYGDYVDYMYDEGNYLEVSFDAKLDPSKPLVVIHSADSVAWHIHPAEEVKVAADGTVTLKMYDLGAVAFLVEAEIAEADAVQSPN